LKPEPKKSLQSRKQWVSSVTYDAIKHFVWGVGDNNPLWVDPEYASTSMLGELVAPPSFAYAIDETTVAPGYEEYERHYQSVEWEWFSHFIIGDQIHAKPSQYKEIHESSGDEIIQIGTTDFRNDPKGLLARSIVTCKRDKNPIALPDNRPEIRYSGDELLTIEDNILSEQSRGSSPRYWEETQVGDQLGRITKGPLSIMDIVAWCAGTQGSPDYKQGFSSGGLEAQAATGPQLTSWLIHLITNWIGDQGFLSRLKATITESPLLGSTTTFSGTIVDRGRSEMDNWCELAIEGHLQNNEKIIYATALIHLPAKPAEGE
jgi:hypothetical protein